jgi:transcriptional regulator with XRE-family HTH domain
MDIGAALRDARKRLGLTQVQLAGRSGLSRRAVLEVENGGGSLDSLFAMIAVLDFRFAGLPKARTLGDQVRALRERRGWSQADLAVRAGVSKPTVIGIERNQGHVRSLSAILAALAPKARQRKSERAEWQGGDRDCRFTPASFMQPLYDIVGGFDLDPCGHPDSPVVASHRYIEQDDGLISPWFGKIFMNPPFSQSARWLECAFRACTSGECELVIGLLPVRTHTKAFHEFVVGTANVILLKGRIKFEGPRGGKDTAPFGCMLVVWGGHDQLVHKLLAQYEGVLLPRVLAQAA